MIYLPEHNSRIIFACGYTRDDTLSITITSPTSTSQTESLSCETITTSQINEYNKWNGEILKGYHLYGVGIGFPTYYRHENGELELWVGFNRTISQTELILQNENIIKKEDNKKEEKKEDC